MPLDQYNILVGPGKVWAAPVGEAFPEVDAVPSGNWVELGTTDGGVKITFAEEVTNHHVDQESGPVTETRQEETALLETALAEATLENLGEIMGNTVTDVAAGSGTIGTRAVGYYRGITKIQRAFLFRAGSPYGAFPAQYELPRGTFGGEVGVEYKKDSKTLFPCTFNALIDFDAATDDLRFGRTIAQDAVALP